MTKWERLQYSSVRNWSSIVQSLSRGDSIEEGHFMERLWAALPSEPISQSTQRFLLRNNNHNNQHQYKNKSSNNNNNTVSYKVVKRGGPYKGLVLWPQQQQQQQQQTELQKFESNFVFGREQPPQSLPTTWWQQMLTWMGVSTPATTSNSLSISKSTTTITTTSSLDFLFDIPMVGMHVVVSYCDQPMDWIWDRLHLLTQKTLIYHRPISVCLLDCESSHEGTHPTYALLKICTRFQSYPL
jgi:hypothetical protein